ncbi:CaiB/BaiF CoA transferase family protein [Mycolicibacterium stellerae]|uniref:CaiB/BaiF CoA transferase family protein n=1 Tax=Mycolicibacterium stellerae TaxID=2358193 RepID=UPI000F0BA184|nr:CaiB/BaiF CoA-transferase family protein [Mycolicibacterium stellerae]
MTSAATFETSADRRGPLADVTVVAVEQAVSAPMCTRTLADLGARVIKIENPRGGDFTRDYDDVVNGMAAHFVWANRGKESVSLDLKRPAGMEIMHRMLASADVLISNLTPGATRRLGIDAESLKARHPRLVSLEISGYGSDGPMAHKRAYDLLIQAESGTCATTGLPGQPSKPGPAIVDVSTGLYAVITILAGLHARGHSGAGTSSSVAMFDAATELMGYALTHARYTESNQPPVGMGSPALAPYGAYGTLDLHTAVLGTTNDAEFRRLSTMIGRPELADDDRYRRNVDRVARRGEVDEIVAAWCAQRRLADIQAAADEAGIGNARYNTPLDVVDHAELAARGRWQEVSSPVGSVTSLLPPPVISGHSAWMGPIPALGEHTSTVLAELGYTDEDISSFREAGTI